MYSMAQYFYEDWYQKDVAPNLTDEQKTALMQKISALTLKAPIWQDKDKNYIDDFPELKQYSHNGKISGLQLCTVMECCLKEVVNQ